MNIVDQFHNVETVGDLKKALAEYDDSAKIHAMFSSNGLLDLSLKNSKWTELYLRVRKLASSLGNSRHVQIIAGEVFHEVKKKAFKPNLDEMAILYLRDKLLFLAGRKDAKSMQGYTVGGLPIEITEQEYGWIVDKLSLDDFFNQGTRCSHN
jgi:hypothetical protein